MLGRHDRGKGAEGQMDTQELHDRGLNLRKRMLGEAAVERRMAAWGEFGAPLQHLINAYAYGDVWNREALPAATKSLAMVAMMAALGRSNELRVHVTGALANGCTVPQIQELLLLVALYCGIPAANEAHQVAFEVLREHGKTP
jgi:4-carboxymuconolactone decarboxylase